jgi:hypothetical protein
VVRTITDGNQGGGTSTTYTNTDGTLTIDNSNYTINSVNTLTKYDIRTGFNGSLINAGGIVFSTFTNDKEDAAFYDTRTKNLFLNLNFYVSSYVQPLEGETYDFLDAISVKLTGLKLVSGTYAFSGLTHNASTANKSTIINGLASFSQDGSDTLITFKFINTNNFIGNTGQAFVSNVNFSITKEVAN